MLWLAGLMGLMAVGAVTFVDPQNTDEEDDLDTPIDLSAEDMPDNFEPDYDSRGGDDSALLPPVIASEADSVVLIEGSDEDDLIDGNDGNDRTRGNEGADTISGGAGNDELRGDGGDDRLGDAGNDTLHGDDGGDILAGGDADDALLGHNANDILYGNAGSDALQGSAGDDHLDGGTGDDTLHGGLDNDTLIGGAGSDVLFGGWGNDVLSGLMRDALRGDSDDADFLNGGGGDDTILIGSGDVVTAGEGADELVLGDWLTSGDAARIMDYSAEDDSIVLIWDDSADGGSEPQISISPDPDVADQTLVLLDGTLVAKVNGVNLLPGDIALVPLSSATQLGLTSG